MAVDSAKLLERDIGISKGAHISASQVKMLKVVNVTLKDVSGNLKDNLVLSKTRAALKKKREEEERRRAREAALEKEKGKVKAPNIPGQGMLGNVMDGLIKILWGMIVIKALDWLNSPGFRKFISIAFTVGKWIVKAAEWLAKSLVNLIDWGYKLYDGATEWIKNTFGEDAAEKFQGFMDGVKSVVQAVIFVKVIIGNAVRSIIKTVTGIFKKIGWVIKQAYKLAKFVINTAIKAAKLILKGAIKVAQTAGKVINFVSKGKAGQAVNAIKAKGSKLLTGIKSKASGILSKVNPKNWKAPKVQAPSWWKKGTSFVSKKASQVKGAVTGAWGKLGNTLKEATKNLGKYLDDISGPLKKAGQSIGDKMKAGLDKMNPMKAIEKLKGKIKPVIQEMLEKNPFVKKIMSWISSKGKGAVNWVLGNLKKIAGNPKLKNLADGLKKSKGSTKALGPVDKIITALMTLIDYVKFGESPINAILKGLGGLVGYGLGFTAAQAAIPVPGSGFLGGIAGSVLGEIIAHQSLKLLAKATPLDEMEDPVMGKEDIAAGKPARMLLRNPEDLGKHMKAPNIQANKDAKEVSMSTDYENTSGGEGTPTLITVPVSKSSSSKTNNQGGGSGISGGSKDNAGDPTLVLYQGK